MELLVVILVVRVVEMVVLVEAAQEHLVLVLEHLDRAIMVQFGVALESIIQAAVEVVLVLLVERQPKLFLVLVVLVYNIPYLELPPIMLVAVVVVYKLVQIPHHLKARVV